VIFEGVVTDITREKLAHDQIDLLRAVVVQSSDSVIIVESRPSGESEILYVNPTFERIFGRTLGELAGMSTLEYSADPTDDIVAKQVAERLAAGSINPFEFQVAGPDGALIWVEARVVTLQRQPDGTVRWAVISARIDERKRVEGELIDARDVAETASRIKSRFLANMSHELRTPLNAIIGFSEIMKNELLGPIGNTKYRGYIEDINSSGQHLLQIVNDVLEMSRIEAGKLELDEQEVEVAAVVRAALRFLQLTAAGAGVVFSPDLPPDLPRLFCDEMRVKQILLNLLSNAVKFSHAGDTIVIGGAVNPDGSLVISVIDTGIGMTEAEIASAFEPFHQIETELSRRNDGTGLGLPLARSLIQLHGGRLELRSEPGAGTTADIIFPPARVLPPAPRWPDPAPTKRARAPAV
jgi:PAS domain S-box-containing protein